MADFDPDAYLGKPSGFDPDAYLAKTSPAPQEKSGFPARSFSKDAADFGYGAITSALGTPGELESLGLKAGQWAGLAPKGEKPLLPGIADVQADADKYLGIAPRDSGMVTAGEYAPAALALAPAGGKLASALAAPVERALKPVGDIASKIGTGVSDFAKKMNPREVIEKLGKPTSISDVGQKIHGKITSALDALTKARKPAADKLFKDYLSEGEKHQDQILSDYQSALKDYYAKHVANRSLSNEEKAAVEEAFKRTAGFSPQLGAKAEEKIPPGMRSLEKERRILNDVASGMDVKGAEGITARAAQDMSDILTKTIQKYVPKKFDEAIEGYKKLSEPINRFNTALGAKVTKEANEYLPDLPKTDPALVPRAFFKSRRSVQELKDLSGDEKFVEQAAKDHVANELSQAKTSDQINGYLQNNRDWLQEFPQIQKQLSETAKSLKSAERTKKAAGVGAGLVGLGVADATVRKILGGF